MIRKRLSRVNLARVNLVPLLALCACQGNAVQQPDRSNTQSVEAHAEKSKIMERAAQPRPVKIATASPPESPSLSVDRFLNQHGRKLLSVDFEGKGVATRIAYGSFRDNFGPSTNGVVMLNTLFHEKRPALEKGAFGIVIIPPDASGKPQLLEVGETDSLMQVKGSPDARECWKPHGNEDGIFFLSEDSSGILYFRNGWRWAFCGD